MLKLLPIPFIFLLCFTGHAQALNKDSLLHALQTAKEDTAKVRLLLNVEKLYSNKNYDSFYYYLNKAEELSKKIKTDKFDFFINAGFVEYYYYKNDYKSATKYALRGRDIAEKQNDMKLLAKSYNNLAAVYNHFGQYRFAIDCILKCLDISEKTKDSISLPVRNLTASNTYYNLKQFNKAIEYARKAVALGTMFDNAFVIGMGLNNMSASYSSLNMLDSSISISKRQLAFAKKEQDIGTINYALINLCYDNFRDNNKKELEYYSKELIAYSKMIPDKQANAQVRTAVALNLIAQQKYDLAKSQLDSAVQSAKEDENDDALGNLYQTYSTFYYLQGNIKEGGRYFFKYDSLISVKDIKELNFYTEELETKYETEKKETQIKLQQAQLRQTNTLNYVFIGSTIGLLIISLLIYRNYRHRQKLQQVKIDELETEKQLTATEAVLKGEDQERTRLAKDLHDGLGGMLSGIKFSLSNMKENLVMTPDNAQAFERSIDMLDSSIKEMRRVAHNMMPEVLVKYGLDTALKDFCNDITLSGAIRANYQSIGMNNASIEQTTAIAVYRVVQELVNNALKHANAQNVLVQLHRSEQERSLAITVEDDGKGFDVGGLTQSGGMGWQNIQNRVDFLKGKFDIQSSQGKGTSVMIEINI
ncbi:MAG: sensor histidine kinase [Filimonas sp.]|nr:sensor histidine kinase [Filimonas sp.]